jgi:hypothetical protein
MENFKEIAEKCLAGKLSGTFIFNNGENIHSAFLVRYNIGKVIIPDYYLIFNNLVSRDGNNHFCNNNVINFIPDMQKQITIDIPEGKVPVMEQTEKGVVITWKEKELTYDDVCTELQKHRNIIGNPIDNSLSDTFHKKVWALRKLINIRNYFGKCDKTKRGYHICKNLNHYDYSYEFIVREFCTCDPHEVVFAKKEHAEQAIKMLGDELKYLFEPC